MSRPIQNQHYAIGFTYKHKYAGIVKYMGDISHEDGTCSHIFAKSYFDEKSKSWFAMSYSEHDSWVENYISEDWT
jgi:hypothetical protein